MPVHLSREARRLRLPVGRVVGSTCVFCGEVFEYQATGPGRPRSYCDACGGTDANGTMRKRVRHLRHRYGIEYVQHVALAEKQDGRCAICDRFVGLRGLVLDHQHVSGAVRALLCPGCNFGLGSFGDDPDRLEAAARYLRSFLEK